MSKSNEKKLEEVSIENLDVATGGGKNRTVNCQCSGGNNGNNDMMMMMMMTQMLKKDDTTGSRRKR